MTFDGIVISRMKIEDIDGVMVVEKSSFTIPWSKNALMEEVTKNKFAKYIIARVKGRVVGYAECGRFAMRAYYKYSSSPGIPETGHRR